MMSNFRPDLVIEQAQGKPVAVVEVQSRYPMPDDVAIRIRRNMLSDGLPAQIPYFLLVSQDVGYLWRGSEQHDPDAPPAYEFSMDRVIARYSVKEPGQRLFKTELEDVVFDWLTYLSLEWLEVAEEPETTLALAGFNDVIKGALILIGNSVS